MVLEKLLENMINVLSTDPKFLLQESVENYKKFFEEAKKDFLKIIYNSPDIIKLLEKIYISEENVKKIKCNEKLSLLEKELCERYEKQNPRLCKRIKDAVNLILRNNFSGSLSSWAEKKARHIEWGKILIEGENLKGIFPKLPGEKSRVILRHHGIFYVTTLSMNGHKVEIEFMTASFSQMSTEELIFLNSFIKKD